MPLDVHPKEGPTGPHHYVLLYNPHKVVWKLKDQIQEGTFRELQTRAIAIGASDMGPAKPTEADPAT